MPYPRKLLGEDEKVVLDFHPHWIFLVKPVAWTILWLLALGASFFLLHRYKVEGFVWRLVAFGVVLVGWAITAGMDFLRWRTTEYVLTSDRLVIREGIISKSGHEIPLENINDISFHQSVFERMVGSGSLVVESAGEQGQEPFHSIPKPHLVQNEIYRQIEENRARMMQGRAFGSAPAPAAPAGPAAGPHPAGASVPRQIEELARLRDQGLLTPEEFEAKKAELLRRM